MKIIACLAEETCGPLVCTHRLIKLDPTSCYASDRCALAMLCGCDIIQFGVSMPAIYPFTAIVGQDRMRRALILNAVDTRIGGVLIRGERGTAKSTAARALAALLPQVKAVEDCRFGCDPDKPATWCTECKERAAGQASLPYHKKTTPFVNLPVSATEDRVVGTLDIEQAIRELELQPPRERQYLTAEERVKIVRAVLGRLYPLSDPFPNLEGEDYLAQFVWWSLEKGKLWPMWAHLFFSP